MFICSEGGHVSESGERRILVPIKVRNVQTTHIYLSKETRRKIAIIGEGQETVREIPFCLKHVPKDEPEVTGAVNRTQTSYIKLERDERDEDED